MKDHRAFQKMLQSAKKRICLHAPEKIAQKSGAVFYKDRSFFELQSLNQKIRITYPDCIFQPHIDEWHKLVILHYLDLADGTAVSTQMISFGGLRDGLVRGTKFDCDMEKALREFLAGKTQEQICSACKALGAEFVKERADLCVVFPFLPHFPIWMKMWLADEEFEASGRFLLSKSADHYLTIEDAVTVGEILMSRLRGIPD